MTRDIAPMVNHGCLQRGISIMRLALGYEKGLPKNWKTTKGGKGSPYTLKNELQDILAAFPRHRVRIICSDQFAEEQELKRREYIHGYHTNTEKLGNEHIFALSYMHNVDGDCHFMLCNPIAEMGPYIRFAVMVSIKEKDGKKM